jgi:hypothetical protein
LIDYPIPGNDDAIRSVTLITKAIADSIGIARKEVPEDERRRVDELEATTYSTETGETTEREKPQRRRPRRKRRPKPEVIAAHLRADDGGRRGRLHGGRRRRGFRGRRRMSAGRPHALTGPSQTRTKSQRGG